MKLARTLAFGLCLALLAACAGNDLADPPANLGDFGLGLNIAVADNMQKVPISRDASVEEWEAAMIKAVDDRFGRYQGSRLFNIGINIDAFALAPPGIPVVVSPKSVLVITANIWDDAKGLKLNPEGKRFTIFEGLSGDTVIGSGLTKSKAQQMATLSYNAVKAVEGWLLENPAWFGLPDTAAETAAAAPAPPRDWPATEPDN
ncbi:MAG: hypothetical protein Q8P60_01555 [Pseudorhodobacter sp.]|nr:hypothetical protein [Pseudorhodobacter sp.]